MCCPLMGTENTNCLVTNTIESLIAARLWKKNLGETNHVKIIVQDRYREWTLTCQKKSLLCNRWKKGYSEVDQETLFLLNDT